MVYYDYNTTNKSFLDMYLYLKSINIKNNNFMLIINNKELIGVDPYDPNLSDNLKSKIIKECKENIYYFLREVMRIPEQGGGSSRYELNRANCAQLFCFLNNRINWLSAPRFLRKTISTECILVWTDLFCEDNNAKLISTDNINSKFQVNNTNKLKLYLPNYIKEISNQNILDYSSVPTSKENAIIFGMGLKKYNIIHYNEAEYVPFIKDIFESSLTSFLNLKMKNFASNNNSIYGMLFESVYSDDADKNGSLDIINSCIEWSEDFYDIINNIDIEKIIHIEYHYHELGKDENWYEHNCILLNNDEKIINREILLKRN